jgi:peptide/nickel transport system permease protein
MLRFVVYRILQAIPVALIVTVLVFGSMWLRPGDPVYSFVRSGSELTVEQLDIIRKENNFDKPVIVQYGIWLSKFMTGDFGRSTSTNRSVADDLVSRGQVTAGLGLFGWVLSLLLAIPVGIVSAVYRGRWPDYIATIFSIGAVAVPGVWLGVMMILVFAVNLGWLPSQGYIPFNQDPLGWLSHTILPALSIGITSSAVIMRQTRSAMLEVLAQDYVRTARAKGMPAHTVINTHALRNALLPVVTQIGMQTGQIFAGAVVIETLFGIPGMGSYVVEAIFNRDYPAVQGGVVVMALAVLLANLATDIAYAVLDPRVKYNG